MNKLLMLVLMASFCLLLVPMTSGRIQYFQDRLFLDDNITRANAFVLYEEEVDDFVSKGNEFEVYILYGQYINTWNGANPDYNVSWCNFTVQEYNKIRDSQGNLINSTTSVYNEYYTAESGDVRDLKYFVLLDDGESFNVYFDCQFESAVSLDTPADFSIIMPTWECKACQFYEWALLERDVAKAEIISLNFVGVLEYIKGFVGLNYEVWLAVFWVIMILILISVIGLIFVGIFWIFLFLKKLVT